MSEPRPFTKIFAAATGDEDGAGGGAPELEPTLAGLVAIGQRTFPELPVDTAAFVRHLGEHTGGAAARLAMLNAADLYLAFAAVGGDAAAIAAIEQRHFPAAIAAVARIYPGAAERDDIIQELREKLFVALPGAPPAIASYSGRGALGGWVRIVAVRIALGAKRAARREGPAPDDSALLELTIAAHPELEHMQASYSAAFKAAFQEAMASLTARERTLLRLHFIDGLTVDELGALHRVHRATAARWIVRAREAVFEVTRRSLAERLALSSIDLERLFALIQSQVDISLARLLQANTP